MAMGLKSNNRYQSRLFILVSSFTWILAFAFFVLLYAREKEFKIESLNSRLQICNTQLLDALSRHIAITPQYLKRVSLEDSMRVTFIDFSGKVRFDTDGDSVYTNHSSRREFRDAMAHGMGYTVRRTSQTDSKSYFYSATRGDSLVVRTALPYNGVLLQTLQVDKVYGGIIILITLIMNIIAYFAIHKIGKTVRSLEAFATKAENGELDSTIVEKFPQDELGEISRHIVNMYIKQQHAVKERDESMQTAIHEEQEKVRIKHQLTNNINHEIKTPVHAIQACLETIVNNRDTLDKDTMMSLTDKAYTHTQRLCSLLHDISVITRISEAGEQIKCAPVSINEILTDIQADIDLLPPEKRMRLNLDVPDNIVINGNASLLYSIFRNLVNNSLSYSGGRDIFISMEDDSGDFYKFVVADNGIGIEEEHLPRLFERFYRIDNGRSRKMGGTGLGLAIVKNAVLFHQGNITVCNRRTGGLQFTFTLHK